MIHSHAIVEDPASIGPNTNVWAFAHVMSGARVGSHCNVGDHAFIESGAVVGNNVTLKNQVMVWEGITIEDDVFVGPGLGSPARFVNYICSCGQKLSGHYLQTDCLACGETVSARRALIQAPVCGAASTST